MHLPEKEYYFLSDLADKDEWDCKVDDLLHYAEIGKLEICVYIDSGRYEVQRPGQEIQKIKKAYKEYLLDDSCPIPLKKFRIDVYTDREKYERAQQEAYNIKKEYFPGDSCPILLRSEGWRNMRMQGHLQGDLVIIMHSQEGAYITPVKRDYAISDLIVTHKEKLRFGAAYELASGNDIKKKRPALRVRFNEIRDVIWRVYCDLKERHDAPTSGQVWQKLQWNYKKYDTEEIIDEITREMIVWTNFKGSRRTLKESSLKGTLCEIKKKKNISKNSN
jgi:hypothetical protein